MRIGFGFRHGLAAVIALLLSQPAPAKDACEGFKWNVAREHALFLGDSETLVAGKTAHTAPRIQPDRLYELLLSPQETVSYAAPASKKMLADGASGGVVRFRVPQSGQYRVSLSVPFWIDVAVDGSTTPTADFGGARGCDTPRKIVVYELPAGKDLSLQFGGAVEERVRFALTAVGAATK